MRYRTLFLLVAMLGGLSPGTVHAQEEASIRLSATVLSSSGHGTSAGIVTDTGAAEEEGEQEIRLSETQEESAEQSSSEASTPGDGNDSGDRVSGEGTSPPESSDSNVSHKRLAIRGQNEVLVEIQTPTAVSRSIVSFSTRSTESVDIGTLEEETTVDIIHLSI